jgi:hypothetical protein
LTLEADAPNPNRPKGQAAQTGAERQRAYRQRKTLRFLEVTDDIYSRLQAIRKQKGWTLKQTVAEALTLLEAELKGQARSADLAEMYKQAVAEQAQYGAQAAQPPRKPKPPPEPEVIEGQGQLL